MNKYLFILIIKLLIITLGFMIWWSYGVNGIEAVFLLITGYLLPYSFKKEREISFKSKYTGLIIILFFSLYFLILYFVKDYRDVYLPYFFHPITLVILWFLMVSFVVRVYKNKFWDKHK